MSEVLARSLGLLCAAVALLPLHAAAQDHPPHPAAHESLFPPGEASGTAWQPDVTPMRGLHGEAGGWTGMLHASAFAQFLYESGEVHRRGHQAGSINWVMGMIRRPAGAGRAGLRAMLSLEPWTIPGCGYPNLLATGEVCDGDSIHDRQHPHDLFMELAAEFDRPLARGLRWQVYGALAGEPALGPPAYPHRASAAPNPIAPISHHWLDSTHISFGVVTAGVHGARWKAEASAFNGREPDEHRANLDLAALDSVAGRVWLLPSDRWALQVSAGHLRDAEAGLGAEPRQDVDRFTASATYHRPIGRGLLWATTAAYGMNTETSAIPGGTIEFRTHAALIETSVEVSARHTLFGRFDAAGKPAHDLHIHEHIERVFTVARLQAGYVRQLAAFRGWGAGVGAHANLSFVPALLAPRYGGRVAPGFGIFVNVHADANGAAGSEHGSTLR